jgi:hypothetical protein
MNVLFDFGKTTGRIKPLHGVNNSSRKCDYGELLDDFVDLRPPVSRLHDTAGVCGGGHYVDVDNIFPDFSADENDPGSYDFLLTDKYVLPIVRAGIQIMFRFGTTIEHEPRKYRIFPPRDFQKWANVCEHIVRHYNDGWADGFRLGIKYWEIWNEPENPPMWTGTEAQYFALYRETANLLRREFPDIRVGGYASCGFYAAFDENADDFYRSFLTWFDDFLAYVTAPETAAPLDFFSWHIYSADPAQVLAHARYCREKLDLAGLRDTEAVLDEWNWAGADMFESMREMPGASFAADVMCRLQNGADVDLACYYDAQPQQLYGGLFYRHTDRPSKAYYALKAFGALRALGAEAETLAETDLAAAAAVGEDGAAAVLVNHEKEPRPVRLSFPGAESVRISLLDGAHALSPVAEAPCDTLTVTMEKNTVLLAEARYPRA